MKDKLIKWETKVGVVYTFETQDKLKLYDSNEEYIGYVEIGDKSTNEILELINDLLKIEHISDIVNLGFCNNMMYNVDSEDLEDYFIDFLCEINVLEFDYQEYIENHTIEEYKEMIRGFDLDINQVGDMYFIVDYDEYY